MLPQSDSNPEANPLVASFHRGRDFGRDRSPSPVRQKCQVTFAPGEVPSSGEPLESYARGDEAYKCLPPTWPARKGPPDVTNWSAPAEELECPLPLEPFMQELLQMKRPLAPMQGWIAVCCPHHH